MLARSLCPILRSASVAVLLLLYVAWAVELDSFHAIFHKSHSKAVIHTPENEADLCHLAIFHPSSKAGCEHDTHFSESERCPLCQAATPPFQVTSLFPAESGAEDHPEFTCAWSFEPVQDSNQDHHGRAPPFA